MKSFPTLRDGLRRDDAGEVSFYSITRKRMAFLIPKRARVLSFALFWLCMHGMRASKKVGETFGRYLGGGVVWAVAWRPRITAWR